MIKKYLFLLFILLNIQSVNAIELTNDNTTEPIVYSNNTIIFNEYKLNISDSISKFSINYDILSNYNQIVFFKFKDIKNNTIIINYDYSYKKDLLFDNIELYITGYYNNIPLTFPKSSVIKRNETYIYQSFNNFNPFNKYDNFDTNIKFTGNEISINQFYSILPNTFYNNKILITNYSNKVIYNSIEITYQDNGIAITKNYIDSSYNKLNPAFQFLFLLPEQFLKFLNFLSLIEDKTLYQYQIYILEPLTYLDIIIDFIFSLLKFIFTMGLIWFIVICSMFIFIYAYFESKDILQSFKIFIDYEIKFLNTIILKPVIWIYHNLIVKVIEMIRG